LGRALGNGHVYDTDGNFYDAVFRALLTMTERRFQGLKTGS
jgi:hypothetical protein